MPPALTTWQKLLVNAINRNEIRLSDYPWIRKPARDKAVAFVAKERKKLVSYVRRLIDDDADRDGEDIFSQLFMPSFGLHVSSGVLTSRKTRTSAAQRDRRCQKSSIPSFSFLQMMAARSPPFLPCAQRLFSFNPILGIPFG